MWLRDGGARQGKPQVALAQKLIFCAPGNVPIHSTVVLRCHGHVLWATNQSPNSIPNPLSSAILLSCSRLGQKAHMPQCHLGCRALHLAPQEVLSLCGRSPCFASAPRSMALQDPSRGDRFPPWPSFPRGGKPSGHLPGITCLSCAPRGSSTGISSGMASGSESSSDVQGLVHRPRPAGSEST